MSGKTEVSAATDFYAELLASVPNALKGLAWQQPIRDDLWYDGTTILAGVRFIDKWQKTHWDFAVVTVRCDEDFFQLEVEGEEWGWHYDDVELLCVIEA